jgi:uncharacterized protein YbaP (TraB family)
MKRFVSRAGAWMLALLLVPSATLAQAQAQAQAPVPLLWKISDQDNAIYLLGSFHLLRKSDYPLSADVEAAFADAEQVLFELDPRELEGANAAAVMTRAALRTRPGTLEQDLGPQLWARLRTYASNNDLPLAQLGVMEPWYLALMVSMGELTRQGLDPALGLDRHFIQRAQAGGKPASGLETIDEQVQALAGMSLEEQRQILAEALDQAKAGPSQVRSLHAAWRAGDARVLWEEMAARMRRDYPALYQRINVARNDAWLARLQQQLDAGSEDALVVVGALHLLGEDGVVEKLRARGYTVERICSACTR